MLLWLLLVLDNSKGPLPSGASLLPVRQRHWRMASHVQGIVRVTVTYELKSSQSTASHLLGLQKNNCSEDSNQLIPKLGKGSIATKVPSHLLLLLFFLLLHAFRMLTANGPSIAAKAMHCLGLQVLPEPWAHCGAE